MGLLGYVRLSQLKYIILDYPRRPRNVQNLMTVRKLAMAMNFKSRYGVLVDFCQRLTHTEAKQRLKPQWILPNGVETNISVYNPITKCKVPLILKDKQFLTWYMCGPTVYDSAHIGHAITYVRSDIIRRILQTYFNINVLSVMGITDIDDKIIKRAQERNEDMIQLTRHYTEEFIEDMRRLNVLEPYMLCRVSEYVPQIIKFISSIMSKGYAYQAENGSVYFDTTKWDNYGKLSKPLPDGPISCKKSALDFALWKTVKKDEPFWESPWGKGRPGWHIECSTIASAIFGNTIDIHSGGVDLTFPHHENEEAQSCCYHDTRQWVNYWLHCGHLYMKDGVKMSKSLKNTIGIREFLEKYTADEFRILCLFSSYRKGIEFDEDKMYQASGILKKLNNFINDCDNYVAGKFPGGNIDETHLFCNLSKTKESIESALADDFDTAGALHALLQFVHFANKMLYEGESSPNNCATAIATASNYVSTALSKFGISNAVSLQTDYKTTDIIQHFINFRSLVKKRALEMEPKDQVILRACDEARKNLSTCGVTVKVIFPFLHYNAYA